MDHIEQLKKIRNDAIERMRASKEFKLAGKLGVLIAELGEDVGEPLDFEDKKPAGEAAPFSNLPNFSQPETGSEEADEDQKVIDELAAEIASDDEINALSEQDDTEEESSPVVLGPFLNSKAEQSEKRPNGSSH